MAETPSAREEAWTQSCCRVVGRGLRLVLQSSVRPNTAGVSRRRGMRLIRRAGCTTGMAVPREAATLPVASGNAHTGVDLRR